MSSMDEVQVSIDPEVEAYPVLVIREDSERGSYAVPRALMEALAAAQDTVDAIQAAIMEHVGRTYPDARGVTEWLFDRANDAKFEAARNAYEAEHPNGPSWMALDSTARFRLLAEAGWTNRHVS